MIDFKKELHKLSEQGIDSQFSECKNGVNADLQALNNVVTRLLKVQGSMGIQVEEMYSILEENQQADMLTGLEEEKEKLICALIAAADLIEDFYVYYQEHYDSELSVQSELMWNTLCKTMASAGLIRIYDENTPFNMQLNSIENVISNAAYQNGFIVKVLKSGYIYNNKVCRKSTVIVNRLEV